MSAQSCTGESEPNDQPAQATVVSGAGCASAELGDGDQDLYAWTVTEIDARQLWSFTLQGPPAGVTGFQLLRVTLAANGVDVAESTKLYEVSAPRGGPITVGPLLFMPGTYYLGVVAAGVTGAYQVAITADETLPAATESASSQDAPAPLPAPQAAQITLTGDLRASDDHFRWTVTEADTSQRWRITAQFPLGEKVTLYLYDSQNNQIVYREVSALGRIDLPRLGLASGDYRIQLTPSRDYATPYRLTLQPDGERNSSEEEEPNDDLQHAWLFDPVLPMNGAFPAEHYDLDMYKLTVDESFAARQWQLIATPSAPADYDLCLLDEQGNQLQCRSSDSGETLPTLTDLALAPGDYYVTFRNKQSTAVAYTLALEELGAIETQRESEPNDGLLYSTPLDEATTMQGRFAGAEDEYYRFTVTGAPQLWRLQVTGDGLQRLAFVENDGAEPVGVNANGATRLRLDDLYLLPGDHFVRLSGVDGEYTLRVIPLGPPAERVTMPPLVTDGQVDAAEGSEPGADTSVGVTEREPNNNDERAERLRFDTPRSGRLSNRDDYDLYRFALAGPEQVRLTVVQPMFGMVQVNLSDRFSRAGRDDGSPIVYETTLGPGDYTIAINPTQPSDDIYYLLLERLNPFDLPTDQEPANDQPETAVPLPGTRRVTGAVNYNEDSRDWYQLPSAADGATPTTTAIISLSTGFNLEVRAGDTSLYSDSANDLRTVYTYTLPTDAPLLIGVTGDGVYTLSVTTGEGLAVQAPPALPLTMTLSAPVAAVAGFWQEGQALDLRLTLTNTGNTTLDLTLNAVSSDFVWQLAATPATAVWNESITLAGGESRTLSLPVTILPDAGVVLAPRFSVRATGTNGAFVTTALDLPVVCGVPPVNPNGGWTTAGALRGGLNVAWQGLGSQPINDQGNDHIFALFDEIVSPAFGWMGEPDGRLTVDLAGDEAVPVAGVILNGFGRNATTEGLRHFEVLLSMDGQAFALAYQGELAAVAIDQRFVFTQPIPARFAQVRLIDNWRGSDQIGLGEFKVIATSDYQPPAPFNLLDPTRGGHVVWGEPLPANLQDLVSPTDEQPTAYAETAGTPATWVVGFHHNRAAQMTALHWRNAPDGAAERRFHTVDVQVSTDSPVGPWQPVTTWRLDPTATTTQTLPLDKPVWARFVRYVAQPPADAQTVEYPTALGIDERPLTDSYRSILAEWGGHGPAAIYEEMQTIHALGSQLAEVEPNNDQTTAQPLASGQPVNGTTLIGQDEDWFKFVVPANVNTLNALVRGYPAVSADVELLDSSGASVTHTVEITGGQLLLKATVTTGSYYLRVHDPKRSIVFTWDTSGSVGPYLTKIYQSLATFTQDIDPQYETVNLLPFGDPGEFLLPEFNGDALTVQQAFTNYLRRESSSSAETNLLAATESLAPRPGVRAVVLMTDAESSSYPETVKLWQALDAVRPQVFSFEISSGGSAYSQDLMQDWAAVSAGHYANMATLSAFEQGFARAACFLRRPATYSLTLAFSQEAPPPTPTPLPTATPMPTLTATATPAPTVTATPTVTPTPAAPGALTVVGAVTEKGQPATIIGRGAVELILDASGSMLQLLDGKPRIQIARETLTNLTANVLPVGTQLALRVFGHLEAGSCRTDLVVPLQPLAATSINRMIAGIDAKNLAKTPIAASLRLVAEDMIGATGQKVVVLVTDGEETCDGDPAGEIANLRAQGIDVRVNIVGFAVADPALQATFEQWATLGGGAYFNANNAGELDSAVSQALAAPFRVLDAGGVEVADGIVNGEAVALPAGIYTLEVLTEPVQQSTVTIGGGEAVTVTVESGSN